MTLHAAFGALWKSDIPLPGFDAADGPADTNAIRVRIVDALAPRAPLRHVNGGTVHVDGVRIAWRDEAVFDLYDGDRIDCLPGPGWTGAMPAAFYGTVAALTLAWRGALPCHASAVEIGARAVLIAGIGGAGKSTLTVYLLERGARLIADDLTIVERTADGFTACRGRPTIRLHPDSAARLPAVARWPVPGDDRGKWLAEPLARTVYDRVPIAGIVLLGSPDGPIGGSDAPILLGPHLFRPRWLAALPHHRARLRTMLDLAQLPMRGLDPGRGFYADPDAVARARQAVAVLAPHTSVRATSPSSSTAG